MECTKCNATGLLDHATLCTECKGEGKFVEEAPVVEKEVEKVVKPKRTVKKTK